mgnify:CR=1 FL=1
MSYKNAMAGLPMGGGKAVVLLDERRIKTPEMLAFLTRVKSSWEMGVYPPGVTGWDVEEFPGQHGLYGHVTDADGSWSFSLDALGGSTASVRAMLIRFCIPKLSSVG